MKKIFFLFFSLSLIPFVPSFSQSEYKAANKIHLDGDAGWDYLTMDDSTGRLFVSHGTMVQVVDTKKGTVIATIDGMKSVHGIALAHDLNKGFITSGRDSILLIFDLTSLQTITKIKVTGANPDAVLYDPFTQKVFTFNGRSSNTTVVDAKTNTVITTLSLPGKPEFSVTDGKGKVFVNIEDKSELCMINSSTLKVEQTWSIKPGEEPSGLAFDKTNHRLFSVCDNKKMVIMNSDDGKIITTIDIGENVDGVAFDPGMKRIYSSNGDGTLTVVQEVNENSFKIAETIVTQKGARTITVDTKSHHVYTPTAEYEPANPDSKEKRPSLKAKSFVVLDIAPIN